MTTEKEEATVVDKSSVFSHSITWFKSSKSIVVFGGITSEKFNYKTGKTVNADLYCEHSGRLKVNIRKKRHNVAHE